MTVQVTILGKSHPLFPLCTSVLATNEGLVIDDVQY